MEFELNGGSLKVGGNIEVVLPDYMTILPREELVEVARASQRDQMIVAAGRHPETGDVVFMTATGKLMTLDSEKFESPNGKAVPIDCGRMIGIETEKGYYEIAVDWAIDNSTYIAQSML